MISELLEHVATIKAGKDPAVRPGQPATFTRACVPGDTIVQGDLYIKLVDRVPDGYQLVRQPKEADLQLVPGNTQGAKHCLDSLEGVEIHRPSDWGMDSLAGPCLVLKKDRVVLHPVHGAVTILAGMLALFSYQRVWDKEQEKARRAID